MPPMMTNPTRATNSMALHCPCHPKSICYQVMVNTPTKQNGSVPAKQMENTPARKIIISYHTLLPSVPSTMGSSTTASNPATNNIMAALNMKSPVERCKRWRPTCPFCTHFTPHPVPVDSDWSEEDWDSNKEREERREKQRKRRR